MMDYYIDIRLLPDPEFPANMLMGALFNKLHRALVDLNSTQIGISFPEHSCRPRTLGSHLRLHGDQPILQQLMNLNWLQGMRDHSEVTEITPVPPERQYRVVRRVQSKTNAERLRRRHIKRHGVSMEQATERIPDSVAKTVTLPYVPLQSHSTRQSFYLFIEHQPLKEEPVFGSFSSYGLSSVATVPWF